MTLPKLHLRDLFWLVLVVAMGCAWGMWFVRASTQNRLIDETRYRLSIDNGVLSSEVNSLKDRLERAGKEDISGGFLPSDLAQMATLISSDNPGAIRWIKRTSDNGVEIETQSPDGGHNYKLQIRMGKWEVKQHSFWQH